ncbi:MULTISPECIES: prepilin-type N-terminal cleavage/methylation domain-containing protein [unclassified Photobacterium]|uniref:PilW family protein n=1 Tax=unclassified Photobacterium TaxID=2628852 RepID=UPI001EDD5576|nr:MULTISPECIES: prepilin-type N-terminal cleavage/methylation domain-containing protein [unclassified Photobacterium]MCG3866314.1 prepilin-type N-terminal cleavage/methylation domain-containing protein [Photobacterium sp. Ph6]MCG3877843.1 prepilin-type N-terminal cleavage/methylation domain-containing protein [Photobacterium sp. Ph5]
MSNAKGFSLIELLIASAVGLLAIGIVGSVFLSGYSAANKRSLELMLQQDVNDAFRLIKEDVLRAGYASSGNNTLRLFYPNGISKANTVYISSAINCLAYVYDTPDGRKYNEVMYNKKDKKLVYRSSKNEIRTDTACVISGASSLLYEKQIAVSDFKVIEEEISSARATSQLINITLAAEIKSSAVSTKKSIQIKTRNWHKNE